jgi:AraC-like DNA-binding protein
VSFFTAKPSWPLSLFVKQYWAIDNCVPIGDEYIQRIVPNGLMELTFYLDSKPTSLDDHKSIEDRALISGHLKSYYDISITGTLSMFSVTLLPFGVGMLLNLPADEIYDHNVPLKYLLPEISCRLKDSLYEANSFDERVSLTEKCLMALYGSKSQSYEMKRIIDSVHLIKNSKGSVQVDDLSDAACLSRKQFERTFLNLIGTTPKQFLKTVRFQNSIHIKQIDPSANLTEIAYCSGYYDQAHMINDYKSLSGLTPGQYFKECDPFSDFFDN